MVALALALLVAPLWQGKAQPAAPSVPRSAEPNQLERRLEAPERRPRGAVELAPLEAAPAPAGDPEQRFVLAGVVIEGATAYPPERFAPLYEGLLAREVTLADVAELAAAITRRYREDGYVLSYAVVPPQDLTFGLLRVEVVEGYLAEVAFTGEIGGDGALLDSTAAKLEAARPLRLATLERYLLLLADVAGVRARATMARLDERSGAHRLTVQFEIDAVQGLAYVDNRGTRAVGRYLALGQVTLNSLLGQWETTRLRASTMPTQPKELAFAEVAQDWTLRSEGTRLGLSAAYSRVEPGASLAPFDFIGVDKRFALRLTEPLIRSRDLSLWAHGEAVWRDTVEDSIFGRLFEDRLRILRAGLAFAVTDPLEGSNSAAVEVSQGLELLPGGDRATLLSRADANRDFQKLGLSYSRYQPLGGALSLQFSAAFQVASRPLASSEEFILGGGVFGRAYDVAELAGDDGLAGAVELQHGLGTLGWDAGTAFLFADGGAVRNRAADGGYERQSLASAGFGARGRIFDWSFFQIDLVKPLTRDTLETQDRNWRLFFSLSANF